MTLRRTPENELANSIIDRFGEPPDDDAPFSFWVDDIRRFLAQHRGEPQPVEGQTYTWGSMRGKIEAVARVDDGLWLFRIPDPHEDDDTKGWRLIPLDRVNDDYGLDG